jgi:hypothetical protein
MRKHTNAVAGLAALALGIGLAPGDAAAAERLP